VAHHFTPAATSPLHPPPCQILDASAESGLRSSRYCIELKGRASNLLRRQSSPYCVPSSRDVGACRSTANDNPDDDGYGVRVGRGRLGRRRCCRVRSGRVGRRMPGRAMRHGSRGGAPLSVICTREPRARCTSTDRILSSGKSVQRKRSLSRAGRVHLRAELFPRCRAATWNLPVLYLPVLLLLLLLRRDDSVATAGERYAGRTCAFHREEIPWHIIGAVPSTGSGPVYFSCRFSSCSRHDGRRPTGSLRRYCISSARRDFVILRSGRTGHTILFRCAVSSTAPVPAGQSFVETWLSSDQVRTTAGYAGFTSRYDTSSGPGGDDRNDEPWCIRSFVLWLRGLSTLTRVRHMTKRAAGVPTNEANPERGGHGQDPQTLTTGVPPRLVRCALRVIVVPVQYLSTSCPPEHWNFWFVTELPNVNSRPPTGNAFNQTG
jgi:hypothetical protein